MNPFGKPHLLIVLLIVACGSKPAEEAPTHESDLLEVQDSGSDVVTKARQKLGRSTADIVQTAGELRTVLIQSVKFGIPMAQIDIPDHWQYQQDATTGIWSATAQGVEVSNTGYKGFMNVGGEAGYYYRASGVQMRPAVDPRTAFTQDVAPLLKERGYEFIAESDAPAVAQADQRGMDPLYSSGPTRKIGMALTSEWKKGDKRLAAVMHWLAFESTDMVHWGYYLTTIETDASVYEKEKNALLYALANMRYNPQYFAAHNNNERQMEQQSWANHNAKMRSDQNAFDAQQRAYRESADATNEAIMGVYRDQSASSDRMQEGYVDMMREEQNAVDPYTGEAIKIESGYNKYYMDQYGNRYGTDDVLNDPNVGNTSKYRWREVPTDPQ